MIFEKGFLTNFWVQSAAGEPFGLQQTIFEISVGDGRHRASEGAEEPLERRRRVWWSLGNVSFDRVTILLLNAGAAGREAQFGALQESDHAQGLQYQRQNQFNRCAGADAHPPFLESKFSLSLCLFMSAPFFHNRNRGNKPCSPTDRNGANTISYQSLVSHDMFPCFLFFRGGDDFPFSPICL